MNKLMSDIKNVFQTEGSKKEFTSFMNGDIEYYDESHQVLLAALAFRDIKFKMEQHHGGEGEGENYYSVYKFTREKEEPVYIQFQGWYQSYEGSYYQEWYFVEPREVLVTQYFPI